MMDPSRIGDVDEIETEMFSKVDLRPLHNAQRGAEPNRRQRRAEIARRRRDVGKVTNIRLHSPVEGIDWIPGVHFTTKGRKVEVITFPEGVETAVDPKTGRLGTVNGINVTYDAVPPPVLEPR